MNEILNEISSQEVWKRIDFGPENNTPKIYEISTHGRIRSFNIKLNNWKYLNPSNVRGYKAYSFKLNRSITKLMHRLVAEAFIEKEHRNLDHVIHLDYDKSNNHFSNLCWVSKDEMFAHLKRNPANKNKKQRRITNSKLTETDVKRLKNKIKENNTPLYKIAQEFGITHTQLNRIRHGKNWANVFPD